MDTSDAAFTDYDAVLDATYDNPPDGWTATIENADKPNVKAFIIVLPDNIILENGQQMVVEFHTKVPAKYKDDDALMVTAFTPANNNFQAHFSSFATNETYEKATAEPGIYDVQNGICNSYSETDQGRRTHLD